MSVGHRSWILLLPVLVQVGCESGALPDAGRSDRGKTIPAPTPIPLAPPPLSFYYTQPVINGAGVIEPMAPVDSNHVPTYLASLDFKFTNTSNQIVGLKEASVSYAGAGALAPVVVAGPDLVDAWSDVGVLMWGGVTWKSAGAGWEDPEDYGSGHWRALEVDGEEVLTAGVSFLTPGGDFTVARLDESGAIEATRLGFVSASVSQARDLKLHGDALYAVGQATYNGVVSGVLTKLDPLTLEPITDFGGFAVGGGRTGERAFSVPGCTLLSVEALEVFTSFGPVGDDVVVENQPAVEETLLYVGAEATCGGAAELVVLRYDAEGDLDTSYGDGGVARFDFPWAGLPVTFGDMGVQDIDGGRVVLAGNVGDRCLYTQTQNDGWCQPAVTRFTYDGALDVGFGGGGWTLPVYGGAQRAAVEAMALTDDAEIYLGGFAGFLDGAVIDQAWYLSRLDAGGDLDTGWGAANFDGDAGDDLCEGDCYQGWVSFFPGDRTGAILDLDLDADELPRAGGFVRQASGAWDFAAARFGLMGAPVWQGTAFAHLDPSFPSATAYGVGVDEDDRTVLAGSAPGVFLGTARLEVDGLVDSELVIRPGESRGLRLPDPRHHINVPTSVTLSLKDVYGQRSSSRTVPLAVRTPPGPEAYTFAIDPAGLGPDEYVSVNQHHELGDAHRGDDGQRFAYDFGVRRFDTDTGKWSHLVAGTDGTENDDHLIWGKPLRAVADGTILECFRTLDDNPAPGERNEVGGGGNMLWVLNDNGEMMLYAHLMKDSMPEDLCPVEGIQAVGLPLVAGEPIGLAGNSGRSGGPHFHTHVQIGHDRLLAGTSNVGLPLLLQDTLVMDTELDPDAGLWAETQDQAVPPGVYLLPE